jgi:hypothetical protein
MSFQLKHSFLYPEKGKRVGSTVSRMRFIQLPRHGRLALAALQGLAAGIYLFKDK